ncbi:MAG: UDP-N-acetylmuramoyl-L-alanine--D-glutamate ligase [Clostridiales Family XIII bacterium]|jgi:UDP-N-acetylmuramoylalanine--D-glutamate ligase|nr:UDP-N-acetylmuramoyl-L-alanine--D-glutamate ligase [Clostridiales Family XIII bacterium]
MDDFGYKNILIVGMGLSGNAVFEALSNNDLRIVCFDSKDGAPEPEGDFDLVVPSPGVPLTLPLIEKARARGAKILGELELAYLLGRGTFVAVTGTNGKTTTTTLLGEIFKAAGRSTVVAGNIGIPVLTCARAATDDTWLITEVSSFQLDTTEAFRPRISVFLNLTPDHLDRHGTVEGYLAAKAKILANQEADDAFVYNADDSLVAPLAASCKARPVPFSRRRAPAEEGAAYIVEGNIVLRRADGGEETVLAAKDVRIPGAHNLENALAAAAAARAAGIDPRVIADTLRTFAGVEHRLELVCEAGGVRYVNDSKGTNPDAAIKALEAVEKDILLIAGGYDKHADFTEFLEAGKGRVKTLILLGATAEKIAETARALGYDDIRFAKDMDEAVAEGRRTAEPGDTVLLSPACASWDMYENYEQRGAHFKEAAGKDGSA